MGEENEIKKKNESIHSYIKILSHQLRSPINAIQSLLKTVSNGFTGETDPKTLHLIERAVDRTSEAENMISDLLDYELYSQKQSAAKEEVDILVLLNSLVTKYSSILLASKSSFEYFEVRIILD